MRLLRRLFGREARTVDLLHTNRSVVCLGRDQLRKAIITAAKDCGCVLLFGGRQSGKTTLLRAMEGDLRIDPHSDSTIRLPVYVDLMQLKYDATPTDFFNLVIMLTERAFVDRCAQRS